MLKIRIIIKVVILVLMLIVRLVTARAASTSIPTNNPASKLSYQDVTTSKNYLSELLYRSPLDECFDVPLSELNSCWNTNKAPTRLNRPPLDECFDVPLRELASCRNASQAPTVAQVRYNRPQIEAEQVMTLVEAVRQATESYKNLDKAEEAGYALFHGCVSGPEEGAMGIHFVNSDLVGDGLLDPMHPEALLYGYMNGQATLIGVEYVVIADAWHTKNEAPPVLMGQLFNYVSSPNRYGIPAFYELHVWAWERNPRGTFADWNPRVSCDEYSAEVSPNHSSH